MFVVDRIEAKNFCSWENLELSFGEGEVVFLTGSNGAGKTSIMNAICWGLFGRYPGISDKGSVIMCGRKKASVKVVFRKEEVVFEFLRERGTQAGQPSLKILKGGVSIEERNYKDASAQGVRILGVCYDTFLSGVYFRQGAENSFCAGEGSRSLDAVRKELFSDILSLGVIEKAKSKVSADRLDTEKLETGVVAKLESLKELISNRSSSAEELLVSEERLAYDKRELVLLDEKLGSMKEAVSVIEFLREAERALSISGGAREANGLKDIKLLEKQKSLIEETIEKGNKILLSIREGLAILLYERGNLFERRALVAKTGSSCPICERAIDDVIRKDILETIERRVALVIEDISHKEEESKNLEDTLNKEKRQLKDVVEHISLMQRVSSLCERRDSFQKKLSLLLGDKKVMEYDQIISLQKENELKRRELASSLSTLERRVGILLKEKELLDTSLKNRLCLEQELEEILLAKKVLLVLERVFGPSGMKALLIHQELSFFQDSINNFLATLFDEVISVKLDTLSELKSREGLVEKFSMDYFDSLGNVREYGSFSGGERRRLDLSVFISTHYLMERRGKFYGLMMFDELFDSLDEEAGYKVLNLLHLLKGFQIIVSSHREKLLGEVRNRVLHIELLDERGSYIRGQNESKK